jgi:hypothetical protein
MDSWWQSAVRQQTAAANETFPSLSRRHGEPRLKIKFV